MREIFFFFDNVEWSSKNLQKTISAGVKANVKEQEIKNLMLVSWSTMQKEFAFFIWF